MRRTASLRRGSSTTRREAARPAFCPDISPYAYCAGDPVNALDPDGRSRRVAKDKKNRIMTISARFYYARGDNKYENKKFEKALRKAVYLINSMSGYTYTDKEDGVIYSVRFGISTINSLKPDGQIDAKENNCILIYKEKKYRDGKLMLGGTITAEPQNKTAIYCEYIGDEIVIAHEMLHALGAKHTERGLMQPSRTEDQSTEINDDVVRDIVEKGYGRNKR